MLSKIVTHNLKAGIKISDVYKKARLFMQDSLKNIQVPKNFGYGVILFLFRWGYLCMKTT